MLLLVGLAGCISGDGTTDGTDGTDANNEFIPRVVVAILDTGTNVYHDEFRQIREGEDPDAHPSTYLDGYPTEVEALPVTLYIHNNTTNDREFELTHYMEEDKEIWENATQETLYHVPGTKFVGLIGFGKNPPGSGHGSMTSSRAGGNNISIPGAEVLLVHVVAPLALSTSIEEDAQARATRWMADQPWIDIQSHSWGMPATCAGIATQHAWGWAEAFKYARDKQLVMVAAGNGHGNTGLTPGYPSQCQDNGGVAGVVTVGATDNDGYTTWGNWFPAVAGDGCNNPAIRESTINETSNNGGGTSSATPFAAGGAASLVLEARRMFRDPMVGIHDGVVATLQQGGTTPEKGPLADGIFTMDELKDVLFHTAISPPTEEESDGDPCNFASQRVGTSGENPSDPVNLFPFIGYGEVNGHSIDHGIEVLRGVADLPERPQEDELYERDQEARRTFWG